MSGALTFGRTYGLKSIKSLQAYVFIFNYFKRLWLEINELKILAKQKVLLQIPRYCM